MLKYRIPKERVMYYFLFFLITIKYLLPYYINTMLESSFLADTFLTFLSLLLIIFFFIFKYRTVKLTILVVVAIYLWLILATLMNHGNVYRAFLHGIQIILICVLLDTITDNPSLVDAFLAVVRDITLFFYIINIFVMLLLPNGIPSISEGKLLPWYLYGNVNTTIKYIIPGLSCSLILDSKRNKMFSIPTLIMVFGVIITALTVYFSATAVVADIIILLWIVFYKMLENRPWVKYFCTYLMIFAFEVFVVIQAGGTNILAFISNTFNKSITLSGRTVLWARAYLYFRNSPLFGHGYQTFTELEGIIGNGYGCHNYYLDMLYQRGIIGFIMLLVLFAVPIIFGWKKSRVSKPIYILIGICIASSVMLLSEPFYDSEILFIPIYYTLVSSTLISKQVLKIK